MFPRSFASEFPNDNPELSDGVRWMCTSLCGAPQPQVQGLVVRPAKALVPKLELRPLARVTPLKAPPPPVPQTPFERFLAAMVRVALSESATHVAAELPFILRDGRLRPRAFGEEVASALGRRGYLGPEGSAASDAFVATQAAWRDVLSGNSTNLSACGANTLDEWGAALLAALLAKPATRSEELKKALRREGVAAFGMREAA